MTQSGMTDRLLNFCNALFGRFRGGLALSNVASATIMSGISGSAVADTSALGKVLIPSMIKSGYDRGFAATLTAAANVVGPIIPPSITFIMISVLTNLSPLKLFLAALIPDILYSVAMGVMAYVIARRRNYPVYRSVGAAEIWTTFRGAFWALLMPVALITGIRMGVFNMTESAAFAVVYALFVGFVVYRGLTLAKLRHALVVSARSTGIIMIVLAGAQCVSWLLAYENAPQATAVQYAREGAVVVAVDINAAAADETAEIICGEGGKAATFTCDVTQAAEVDAVVTAVERDFGRIDILHNNVGLPTMGSITELDEATWRMTMDANLTYMFLTCKRVLPVMVRRNKGVIINISSIAAVRYTGYPYPAYYAGKAGVNHLTASIAMEYATRGIRANAIMPGVMDTPHIYKNISGQYASHEEMVAKRNALCPMGRMGTGWDIARAAAFLASDDAQYITGVSLPVDGGYSCRS